MCGIEVVDVEFGYYYDIRLVFLFLLLGWLL